MHLNNCILNSSVIKRDYKSITEFLRCLPNRHDIVADVIINNKVVSSSVVTFSMNSGHVIGSVDTKISLSKPIDFDSINIILHVLGNNETLMTSYTDNLFETIHSNDVELDFYFKVGSVFPDNNLKQVVPESFFYSLNKENIKPTDFNELQNVVEDIDDAIDETD